MLFKLYRFGVILAAGVLLLIGFSGHGPNPESLLLHLGSRLMPEGPASGSVAVVAIDEKTIEEHGAWPWSRDQLARVVDRLAGFKPASLGFTLPLDVPEAFDSITAMRQKADRLEPALRKPAIEWIDQLDTDAELAQSFSRAGNVVLAATYAGNGDSIQRPGPLKAFDMKTAPEPGPWYRKLLLKLAATGTASGYRAAMPLPVFLRSASGIGLMPDLKDRQWMYGQSLAVGVEGHYLPGLELSLRAAASGMDTGDMQVVPGKGLVTNRGQVIGMVDSGWYPRPALSPPVYSLSEVMKSDKLAGTLRGKTVLLGLTAADRVPVVTGPAGGQYTPVTWSAQVLDSLIAGTGFSMPTWFYALQRLLIISFATYLILIPVTWHGPRGLLGSLAVAAIIINAGLITLIVKNTWLPVVMPAGFLVATHLVLLFAWKNHKRLETALRALLDTRLALATQLQSQGQLDQAMEQYLLCLPNKTAIQPLYELGLEYERHRQAGKARSIYENILKNAGNFRDARQRHNRLVSVSERFPSSVSTSPGKTLVLDAPVSERPVLGRYRVERELGHGAMGIVYLAIDPTLGREVAIKTLPLLKECEDAEQAAVAERFFLEAEAVGRLNHPHIVTVYDAGREHDLAYLAMDYVSGTSLDHFSARPELLPVWEVLEIAAQVADALDYAHRQGVVHRDVKPGNIMYDREGGIAKLTDFGVARLLDTSRTRTGTILGSPSYMSPEQVAGKKADGRSDLFSLGVTLYQLLTGSLPFTGDSVATLMYQIANQGTPAIRKVRSGLPVSVARLINKSMQKKPASRFDSGNAMAQAIRKCRAQVRGGRRKTA